MKITGNMKAVFRFIFISIWVSVVVGNNSLSAQQTVKMSYSNGVYQIPCTVNGLKLNFIFDTGAADVFISLTEALFMYKNGYLADEDFIGTQYYMIANGDIEEGAVINLRELRIGNRVLHNIQAGISNSLSSPLLLGQSALSQMGRHQIDYTNDLLILYDDPITRQTQSTSASSRPDRTSDISPVQNFEFEELEQPAYATVNEDTQLRSAPGQFSEIIKTLKKNSSILLLGKSGVHWKCNHNGTEGFIHEMSIVFPEGFRK